MFCWYKSLEFQILVSAVFSTQSTNQLTKMFKFLVFVLLIAAASAQWRQGVLDPRCPTGEAVFPTFLPGQTCTSFFICNGGFRCKLQTFLTKLSRILMRIFILVPFECPGGNHWNAALSTCDLPQDAGCQLNNRWRFEAEEEAEA